MKVRSFMRHAQEFTPVEVELSLSPGLPQISFLGMPDPFIRESVTRIKSALRAQGFNFPKAQQVLVQLRPSHLKKTSRGLDLAVAAALIWETDQAKKPENLSELSIYGELSLKGEAFAPDDIDDSEEHLSERDVVVTGSDLRNFNGNVWRLKQLRDLAEPVVSETLSRKVVKCVRPGSPYKSFTQKQAELISLLAAGGHTSLIVGTPGSGKSATAESINSFLPAPSPEEWKAIRKIHSLFYKESSWRPNVVVHHSITALAMTGGGSQIRPGEITRAHGGTLIMDELLEFKTAVQESLREPLESGKIEIARQGKFIQMPARFQLIATSNLCRCGNYAPESTQKCRCAGYRLRQYQERFSGPMIDRLAVVSVFLGENSSELKEVSSDEILKRVLVAGEQRALRGQSVRNAEVSSDQLLKFMNTEDENIDLFTSDLRSHRSKIQILQVARTLADLDDSEQTRREHFVRAEELVIKSRKDLIKALEN